MRFRAIFAAYNEVHQRNGLDPDNDQTILRFLLKLGDKKRQKQSLYESFELLLQEFGIQLEINGDQASIQDITRSVDEDERDDDSQHRSEAGFETTKAPSRRNSFDSPGIGRGKTRKEQDPLPPRPSTRASFRPTEKLLDDNASRTIAKYAKVIETRDKFKHKRGSEGHSSYESLIYPVDDDEGVRRTSQPLPLATDEVTVTPERRHAHPFKQAHKRLAHAIETNTALQDQVCAVAHNELLYRPSETQFLRDADTFQHFRIRALLLNFLQRWSGRARLKCREHKAAAFAAALHDRHVLLQQGFELWRSQLHISRQANEARRFYHALEDRASKARDLYLLTKAFTHWAESTAEQVVRTDAARQHILRLKYFSAWREITAVNELKVRRHTLMKCFRQWRERSSQCRQRVDWATVHHDEHLARWVHWKWFWTFCETRIPIWRDARAKRTYFVRWNKAVHTIQDREWHVQQEKIGRRVSAVLTPWLGKARNSLIQTQKAETFYHHNAQLTVLKCWIRRRQYVHREQHVVNMVDWRVAGTTFTLFVARFRSQRQATMICKLRIARNAWTIWNDNLRSQIMAHRINDRLVIEALYKWVIAERSSLLVRLQEERLQKATIIRLYERCSEVRARRDDILRQIVEKRNRRIATELIQSWRSKTLRCFQNRSIAHAFLGPRLTGQSIALLSNTYQQVQQLSTWATRYDFFVTGKRVLKTWRNEVDESRKRKRQQAYGQVRRRSKMALASGLFSQWKEKTNYLRQMNEETKTHNQERLLRRATDMFDYWRAKTESMLSLAYQSEDYWMEQTTIKHLRLWHGHHSKVKEEEGKAATFYDLHLANIASSWLHGLRLKIIDNRANEAKASAVIKYYERRRVGARFRQWQSRTMEKLRPPVLSVPPSSRARRSFLGHMPPIATVVSEEVGPEVHEHTFGESDWIPQDISAAATPAPGYLSTPSKRAARAKALTGTSITPAGTPFSSRFRRPMDSSTPSPLFAAVPKTPFARLQSSNLRFQSEGGPQTPRS